tara:strand:- start:4020 stop:4286 length:267 start_codon:yes stop_codon:yes gene_type:complete
MSINKEKINKLISKFEKSKSNVKFSDLIKLIIELGYTYTGSEGSHHNYRKMGEFPISIQPDKKNKSKAKEYQVNQILKITRKFIKEES